MGTWGTTLYGNDLARDLKATISAVLKLPLETPELIDLLQTAYPGPSTDQRDEEYTTFWLVVADQFHKSGVAAPELYLRARNLIDTDFDLSRPERLEMSQSDRTKRQKMLQKLGERLAEAPAARARKTLKKPQPLLFKVGDIVIYPVLSESGESINPYLKQCKRPPVGWRAACIIQSTQIFNYLACYTPLVQTTTYGLDDKPDVQMLVRSGAWQLRRPGTCSKLHFQRMRMEIVGNVELDTNRLQERFPDRRDGRYQAMHDISISNALTAGMDRMEPTIDRLELVLAGQ